MNPDSLTLLLLCTQLGLDDDSAKPLTLREWNPLVRKMQAASLRPSDLPHLSDSDLRSKLDLDEQFVIRISYLAISNQVSLVSHPSASSPSPAPTRTIPKNTAND